MRYAKIALFALLALESPEVRAQEFTTLDWDVLRIDSLLPVYTEVVPLESDYRLYDYRVSVEYPEWKALTAEEVRALLPYRDSIGAELRLDTHVGVSRRQGLLDISFVPIVSQNGKYRKLVSAKFGITPVPKAGARKLGRGEAAAQQERFTRTSKLATGKWVKISIKEDGMYSLTPSALRQMGFSKPENVHLYGYGGYRLSEVMNPEAMYDDLVEVPLYREKAQGTAYFWGNGLVYWDGEKRIFNPYSTKAYYFLTEEVGPSEIGTETRVTATAVNHYTSAPAHTLYERDEFSWQQGGRNLYDAQTFGVTGRRRTYTLQDRDRERGGERLTVVTSGFGATLTPTVNGKLQKGISLGEKAEFVFARIGSKTYNVEDCAPADRQWTVALQSNNDNEVHLDYIALHYNRLLNPQNGFVPFSQKATGVSSFHLSGQADRVRVMRLSEPGSPCVMIPVEKDNAGVAMVTVQDPSRRYVAFTTDTQFPEPQFEGAVENQNLHALDSLDMVILIPASGKLQQQAERLAEAHRTYDGLRVGVVRADQVYNEFSSGTPDATAYRMLMKMLYDRADGKEGGYEGPRYLLLMGACFYDNRMLTPAARRLDPNDYLLCFESENSWSDPESYVMEDYFGLLDDGEGATLTKDKSDLGVGRFPVRNVQEAKVMVDKSIAFLSNSNAGSWKNKIMMLGDDGDANSHMNYCNVVAERVIALNPEMEVQKVMWDAYDRMSSISNSTYPEVASLMNTQLKDGVMVVNYTGHGAPYTLSHEWVFRLQDFYEMKGANLPVWFTAACDVMPFDSQKDNIGVTAVLNEGGGALAFVGTARTVYASNNKNLNNFFMEYLLGTDEKGRRYSLGDALRLCKVSLVGKESFHLENKLQYALMGDPALVIGAPQNRVQLEKICDAKTGEKVSQLKAGQAVRMEGRLVDARGNELKDFNGILTTRIYDSLDSIVCKMNDPSISTAFTFTDRNKVLYAGSDSVRLGKFAISFVVPQDIKYTNESGRVVFYAINDRLDVEANGYNEDFTVGGMVLTDDTKGPEMELALNGEFGGTVNSTPYFTARLADDSGINVSGAGIGHDLQLCVDGDPKQTYVLNKYYREDFGDYTRGAVAFTLPDLEPGSHTLTLRAWDMLNNTSTRSMDFRVNAAYKPSILQLVASPTIATESTTFLLTYDLPGTKGEYTIEVFDFSGRLLWKYSGEDSSSTGRFAIPWNLSVGDGRGRISPGVYLYRATLKCGDSKHVSESRKLIVH